MIDSTSSKLILLRSALKQNSLNAYIIPVASPHPGENIPDHWQIVKWLTGFDGSAGVVVITDSFAGLWTDSRYYLQAGEQLKGSEFELMMPGPGTSVDYIDWLEENPGLQRKIGLDGRIFSLSAFRKLEARLLKKGVMIDYGCDLIKDIWSNRPRLPSTPAFDHPVRFAGKERAVKMREVRDEMKKLNISYHLLTSCDDIMWLLNIRGRDFTYSPLLMSFAMISEKQVFLFSGENSIPPDLVSEFEGQGIVIRPYDKCSTIFSSFTEGSILYLNPGTTSVSLWSQVPGYVKIFEGGSIPAGMKAIKNKTEIENLSRTMVKDGTALTKFFYWFESSKGVISLTERSVKEELLNLRARQVGFLGPSFNTIAAFNEHAALPHYTETSESNANIDSEGILLIDSGGHYQGGTTDITRTISLGFPTLRQKKDFTLVLKGHISLATAKFPLGTRGYQLDILARKALWENGLNYGHGTGHGVGYCLNVHEGPQNISPADNKTAIEPGMLLSNEPAIYREGEYGIRTENLMICYEDEETEFGHFLKFDTISLCYIDKSLIDKSLLDQKEIDWLNSYHAEVYEKISPHLTEAEKFWLKTKTEPV
jgi:Xaa-Pro aminopeptidase